jgi:hypothetical protein
VIVNLVRACRSRASFYELATRYPSEVRLSRAGRGAAVVRLRLPCGRVTVVMWEGSDVARAYGAPCEPDFLYDCRPVLAVGRAEAGAEGVLSRASLVCESESVCRGYLPLDGVGLLPIAVYLRGGAAVVVYFAGQGLADKISLIERIISSL